MGIKKSPSSGSAAMQNCGLRGCLMHRKPAVAKTSKIADSAFPRGSLISRPELSSLRSFAGLCSLTPSAGAPACR